MYHAVIHIYSFLYLTCFCIALLLVYCYLIPACWNNKKVDAMHQQRKKKKGKKLEEKNHAVNFFSHTIFCFGWSNCNGYVVKVCWRCEWELCSHEDIVNIDIIRDEKKKKKKNYTGSTDPKWPVPAFSFLCLFFFFFNEKDMWIICRICFEKKTPHQ